MCLDRVDHKKKVGLNRGYGYKMMSFSISNGKEEWRSLTRERKRKYKKIGEGENRVECWKRKRVLTLSKPPTRYPQGYHIWIRRPQWACTWDRVVVRVRFKIEDVLASGYDGGRAVVVVKAFKCVEEMSRCLDGRVTYGRRKRR